MIATGEESLGVVTKGTKAYISQVRKLKYFGPATVCRRQSCVRNSGRTNNHGFFMTS